MNNDRHVKFNFDTRGIMRDLKNIAKDMSESFKESKEHLDEMKAILSDMEDIEIKVKCSFDDASRQVKDKVEEMVNPKPSPKNGPSKEPKGPQYTPLDKIPFIDDEQIEMSLFDKIKKGLKILYSNKPKKEDTILGGFSGLAFKQIMMRELVDFIKSAAGNIKQEVAQSLSVASDIEETDNVVRNSFKQHMETMDDLANNSIKQLGISSLKAKQYASTYKAMMSGLADVSEDTKVRMAETLTGMAADIGSFFSATISTDQAFEMLKAPLDKQSLKVARIGVNMTESALEDWLELYDMSYSKLGEQEKTLARIAYIMDRTEIAQGDFIKNSDSWHNQLELIRNKAEEIRGIYGALFIDVLKPMLTFVNNIMDVILSRADMIIDKIYNILGLVRESKDENKGIIGDGIDITDVLSVDPDSDAGKVDKDKASDKDGLDILGIDNIETLKTDYSDPEKEKDRDERRAQADVINKLLKESMDRRDENIKKLMLSRKTEESELFKYLKGIYEAIKDEFGDNFLDIFDGLKSVVLGIKEFIGDLIDGFIKGYEEVDLGDLIDKITQELSTIGGIVGDLFGDGDSEDESIGSIIGRVIAYMMKIYLSILLIKLRGITIGLSILRDTGLLNTLAEDIADLVLTISQILEGILNAVLFITKPILDPEGAAEEYAEGRREWEEKRDSGEYGTFELATDFLKHEFKNDVRSLVSAIPDAIKTLKGKGDQTFSASLNRAMGSVEYNGPVGHVGRSNEGVNNVEVDNDVRVYLDGEEISRKVEDRSKRGRRIKGAYSF